MSYNQLLAEEHPQTGETLYWEHVGRPDDAVYRASFLEKLDLYIALLFYIISGYGAFIAIKELKKG